MATETVNRGDMRVGYETLRDDMQQLADDFKEVMQSLGEKSKDAIVEGRRKAGSAIRSWCESATDRASNVYERISRRGKDAVEKSRKRIAMRPITYMIAALAAGMALGAALKRIKYR